MQSDFFSKFGQIQNGMSDGLNNLSQVMEKTEEIFSQLSTYNMSVRLLDMSAWQPVINQLNNLGVSSLLMQQIKYVYFSYLSTVWMWVLLHILSFLFAFLF